VKWVVVDDGVIDAWLDRESDDVIRMSLLDWLIGMSNGPGHADGVPTLTQPGVFVARVPDTSVVVTYLVGAAFDPPFIAIRSID